MKAFGNWLRKGEIDEVEKKALYESDDTLGGFYAPAEYVAALIKGVTEISPIRSIARVRTTSNRGIEIPKRTGQFSASFVAETGTRSETTGYTTGLMQIDAHELYALQYRKHFRDLFLGSKHLFQKQNMLQKNLMDILRHIEKIPLYTKYMV